MNAPARWIALLALGLCAAASAQLAQPVLVSPGLPAGAAGADYETRTPTFRWRSVVGATWYQVWCDATPAISKWVEAPATNWALPSTLRLEEGRTYRWWARAWSAQHGYGPWSAERVFTAKNLRTLFLPAAAFRPVDSFSTWQFLGSGLMIGSGGGLSAEFVAPLPLPAGTHLCKATVHWRNNLSNAGTTAMRLRFANAQTGHSWDLWNLSATTQDPGMQSAWRGTATNDALIFTDANFHVLAVLAASNTNRWLHGVAIDYFE